MELVLTEPAPTAEPATAPTATEPAAAPAAEPAKEDKPAAPGTPPFLPHSREKDNEENDYQGTVTWK
jgi:hypothetical protein